MCDWTPMERAFDHRRMIQGAPPPGARPAQNVHLRLPNRRSVEAFQPVAYREQRAWRFGMVSKWIQVAHSPWIARIRTMERDAQGSEWRNLDSEEPHGVECRSRVGRGAFARRVNLSCLETSNGRVVRSAGQALRQVRHTGVECGEPREVRAS